jgi:phosphatidylglycerophosphate synthase
VFDPLFVKVLKKPLDRAGKALAGRKVSADTLTWCGFAVGLMGAVTIANELYLLGLILILLNRVADGLDGAVARATRQTDFGGYLDIVLDFIAYSAIAGGFALSDPSHTTAAVVLMVSFMGTASAFLAFAVIAAKRNLSTDIRGQKSFFYVGGIVEGSETIAYFVIVCIWPEFFVNATWIFIAMCWITVVQRVLQANGAFGETTADDHQS